MEDSVTDSESLMQVTANHSSSLGVRTGEVKEEEKEENRGGIISNLISNLVSPVMSPRSGGASTTESRAKVFEVENGEHPTAVEKDKDGGGNGGKATISNLISNLFHHQPEGEARNGGKKTEAGEENGEVKNEEENVGGGRGGGIIDNLVSHLPASLTDEAVPVPTTDEASILIHSIIHD